MKVGVLTFNGVANYGAILQGYALFNVLRMADHDVEMIDYSTYRTYKLIQKHLYANPYFAFNAVKEWRMNNFSRKHMKLTARKYRTSEELKKYTQNFDLIICGSDEIWNINLPFQNYDFNYFLDFVYRNIPKISYAASNKIGDILRELNVEDRILSPLKMSLDLKHLELKIDLNLMKINLDYPKLQQMIHDSNHYLDRALSVAANTQEIKQT